MIYDDKHSKVTTGDRKNKKAKLQLETEKIKRNRKKELSTKNLYL
jgi:hypothetical protein